LKYDFIFRLNFRKFHDFDFGIKQEEGERAEQRGGRTLFRILAIFFNQTITGIVLYDFNKLLRN